MIYLFLKWLHIIAIISWMAGILYLIRLFVNHVEYGQTNKDKHELLLGMEERLYRIITFPAMVVAWFAGFGMLYYNMFFFQSLWLHIKLFCVILLTILTLWCGYKLKEFAKFANKRLPSGKFLRILNEIPTILMFIIVGMVVFKP